jgi:MFS family permease
MYLALPLASVAGSLSVGQLVAWQGYPLMFAVLAGVWAGWPVVGLLGLEDKPIPAPAHSVVADGGAAQMGRGFYLVLAVALLSATAIYVTRIGTSLSMQALSFSPRAVASTAAVGGLVTIPITLLIGALSDRLGRKTFLMLSYLVAAVGAAALAGATQLWHFWLASALLFTARSANGSVAAAYATDLLPAQALSRGLPWLNAMGWVAGIVGSASAGYLIDAAGAASVSFIAAALSVAAAALIGFSSGLGRSALPIQPGWGRDRCAPEPCPAMS